MAVLTTHAKSFEGNPMLRVGPFGLSGAPGRLDFAGFEAWARLEAPAAVKDFKEVVAFAQVVR